MFRKIFATNEGIKLTKISAPSVSTHDVLIEVHSSFYSPGTENASLSNIKKSSFQKAIKFRKQIIRLIKEGDIFTLIKKAKAQTNVTEATGYSIFGKVIQVGSGVDNVRKGQYVIAVGPHANHSNIAIVPKGLVMPVEYNHDFCAVALVGIALNAIEIGNFKPFSKICILGGGLLGQLILQLTSKSGMIVDVMDTDTEVAQQSIKNGASSYIKPETFGSAADEYDAFISTVPVASKELWNKVTVSARNYAKIILVGAANLEVPRESFYKKKLSFHTAFSYGTGRGDYEFETLNLRAREYTGIASTLDKLIEKSVDLIRKKIIDLEGVQKLSFSNFDAPSSVKIPISRTGLMFIWETKEKKNGIDWRPKLSKISGNTLNLKLDVLGNSAFFNDSHKPALFKYKIPIVNIINRSPEKINEKRSSSQANAILISTPHDEHWPAVEKFPDYQIYFIDKPLAINKDELMQYSNSSKTIVSLMNRRYSEYTINLKKFLDQFDDKPLKVEFTFSVPLKSISDPIFHKGGRIIGEMCHHIDLAIYLNGKVSDLHSINFDSHKEKWRNERHLMVLKHENDRVSIIKYWPGTSPFFRKEAIIASAEDKFFAIKDFSVMESNIKYYRKKIFEKDKGCAAMWKELKWITENNLEGLQNLCNIDKQVYGILAEVSF